MDRYLYVGVRFPGSYKTYQYICDDETVEVGDSAVVPSSNGPIEVTIVTKGLYTAEDTPYPLLKTKHIPRIIKAKEHVNVTHCVSQERNEIPPVQKRESGFVQLFGSRFPEFSLYDSHQEKIARDKISSDQKKSQYSQK